MTWLLSWFEGWDYHLGTSDLTSAYWTIGGTTANFAFQSGRDGYGQGAALSYPMFVNRACPAASTVYVGVSFQIYSAGSPNGFSVKLRNGSTDVCAVFFNPAGNSITAYRGNAATGVALGSASFTFPAAGNWISLEVAMQIGASGAVLVDVGGSSIMALTGVNTGSGTADFVQLDYADVSGSAIVEFDDTYVATDTAAASAANFLGPCAVRVVHPDGTGALAQWTAYGGVANWQSVDDSVFNADNTYNFAGTSGNEDAFVVSAVDSSFAGNAVYGFQVTNAYRSDTGGSSFNVSNILRVGSTDYAGATNLISGTSYVNRTDLWALNPATSNPWTTTAINALQLGYRLG